MASIRRKRINEIIRRVVSQKIIQDVKDPRIGFVTVTKADIADDLRTAEVYVSIFEEDLREESIIALNSMRGYIQKSVGDALQIRNTPVLTFVLDISSEKASFMSDLIRQAREGDSDGGQNSNSEQEATLDS